MGVIFKHTFRAAMRSKMQTLIIMLTIILVTAMLFTSLSLSNVFYLLNTVEHRRLAGDAHLQIGNSEWYSDMFNIDSVTEQLEEGDVEYTTFFYRNRTTLKTESDSKVVMIEATDFFGFTDRLDFQPIEYAPLPEYTKQPVQPAALSAQFARENGISAGDYIEIYASSMGRNIQLFVTMLCAGDGYFASSTPIVLMDVTALNIGNSANLGYVRFKDSSLFDSYRRQLEPLFGERIPMLDAQTSDHAIETARNNTRLLVVAVIFITAAMMLILLTSYLIIARHRMSDMIIFKAAGATPMQTALIMLLEVLLYSVVGGIIGLVAGRLLLGATVGMLLPQGGVILGFALWKYALSFALTVLTSLAACLIPIVISSRKTIRALTSDTQRVAKDGGIIKAVVSLVVLVAAFVAISLLSGLEVVIFVAVLIASAAFFTLSATPVIIRGISALLSRIRMAGSVYLASRTVKRVKGLHLIAVLFVVLIVFSFMVFSLIDIVKSSVTPYLLRFDADVIAVQEGTHSRSNAQDVADEIAAADGVERVGFVNQSMFMLVYENIDITLMGVSDIGALKSSTKGLTQSELSSFGSTQNAVVLSEDTALRYGYSVGDTLAVAYIYGNEAGKVINLTVVALDKTRTEWDGIGFVHYENVESCGYTTTYYIDGEQSFLNVRDALDGKTGMYVLTQTEWIKTAGVNLGGLASLLSFVQYFLLFISLISIANISAVTVFDRRNEYRVYAFCGMGRRERLLLSLFEGLFIIFSAVLIGMALSTAFSAVLPAFTSIIGKHMLFEPVPSIAFYIASASSGVFLIFYLALTLVSRHQKGEVNRRLS